RWQRYDPATRLAEAGDIALSAVGEDAVAPPVVGAHLLVRRLGVAVAMQREAERQPRRDKRRRGRYADAETRHREHMVRQTQEPAHLLGVIADHADRAATEARRRRTTPRPARRRMASLPASVSGARYRRSADRAALAGSS